MYKTVHNPEYSNKCFSDHADVYADAANAPAHNLLDERPNASEQKKKISL